MKFRYILHKNAQEDYEASLQWYLERSEQAAQNFIAEVDKGLQLLCNDPNCGRNTYKQFHEFKLKIFPFCIVYVIEAKPKLVVITSIFHDKRNPKKKYSKK